jgi:hypothetical protein
MAYFSQKSFAHVENYFKIHIIEVENLRKIARNQNLAN